MPNAVLFIDRPKASTQADGHCAIYLTSDQEPLKWSANFPLPAIGDSITILMNGIGPATVVGYFKENGYLGVMTRALEPPDWLIKQREREKQSERWRSLPEWRQHGIGCEFGAEIAPA